jgi:predicted unusual protein kinase regulating ubiquinone biosynthesis (AarF/ABC1/UbiB family)
MAACTGWMHADLQPGNFLLLPGGRLGMLDFGAAADCFTYSRPW